eukprot:s9_g87.t1
MAKSGAINQGGTTHSKLQSLDIFGSLSFHIFSPPCVLAHGHGKILPVPCAGSIWVWAGRLRAGFISAKSNP